MNTRAILAIVRKDLKVAVQNKGVVLPIVLLPLIIFVIMPWVMVYVQTLSNASAASISNMDEVFARMPSGLLTELSAYTHDQQLIVFMLVYMLAPLFLILPLMVSSVLAADSFAGEKERKTLEALLYTPTTDRELFTAKLLGGWTAAVVVAILSFVLYAVVANAAAWQSIGHIFFPNWMWVALVFWVTPAVAGLGLVVMVFVSVRAQGFQDAYQTGGLIVLPILALMIGQISGVMYFSLGVVLLVGLVIWLLDLVLLWFASKSFRRGELMTRFEEIEIHAQTKGVNMQTNATQAGSLSNPRLASTVSYPWLMLFSRSALFLLVQALIAVLAKATGATAAWDESARWWTFIAFFANLGSLYLLVMLFRGEGKRFFDILRFSRQTWKTDLLWFVGFSIVAMPFAAMPREPLAAAIFGDAMTATNMMFRPIPTWAFALSFLFPLTIWFAELPTYFGYCMPRLEAQLKNGWLAWILASLFLAGQHMFLPLILNGGYLLWRFGMFLPFALITGLALKLRPSLLPYFVVVHALIDVTTVLVYLMI